MASSARARFGELERAVLDVLWTRPSDEWLTVRQVHELLAEERDLAYTTAMTVLDRMAKKGLLDRRKEGRAYAYRAHTTRADMTAGLMRETLEEVAAEDRTHALVAFVGEADPDEVAALRRALAALDG